MLKVIIEYFQLKSSSSGSVVGRALASNQGTSFRFESRPGQDKMSCANYCVCSNIPGFHWGSRWYSD